MKQAITILNDTTGQMNVTGAAFKAAGYFGYNSGVTTVAYYLNDFIGRVSLEGSLATNPKDSDWFPLNLGGIQPYVQYPLNPISPTGTTGDSGIQAYTFEGNIVWIRIIIDRSYLVSPDVGSVGSVTRCYLNY